MTNLGAHHIDIVHFFMDVLGPTSVYSAGGRFALEDNGETPDTQDAIYEYPGFTAIYSCREASLGHRGGPGLCFYGTKGSLQVGRGGSDVVSDMKFPPENAIPRFQGAAVGGARRQQVKPEPWTAELKQPGSSDDR